MGTVLSTELPTDYHHQVERSLQLVCVEGPGSISRSGLTQDIKMGSCILQCDVQHQWIGRPRVCIL